MTFWDSLVEKWQEYKTSVNARNIEIRHQNRIEQIRVNNINEPKVEEYKRQADVYLRRQKDYILAMESWVALPVWKQLVQTPPPPIFLFRPEVPELEQPNLQKEIEPNFADFMDYLVKHPIKDLAGVYGEPFKVDPVVPTGKRFTKNNKSL